VLTIIVFLFLRITNDQVLCLFAGDEKSQNALLHELTSPTGVAITQDGELVSAEELSFMDLSTILAATDHFSDSNKLGNGGFGTVYKVTPTFFISFQFTVKVRRFLHASTPQCNATTSTNTKAFIKNKDSQKLI
jgi:hypothetical protein